eukprot:6388938-Karenia_brevis.AAC.1
MLSCSKSTSAYRDSVPTSLSKCGGYAVLQLPHIHTLGSKSDTSYDVSMRSLATAGSSCVTSCVVDGEGGSGLGNDVSHAR